MDFIAEVKEKRAKELEEKIGTYETACFICGHAGEPADLQVAEMTPVIVKTMVELIANKESLCVIRDELIHAIGDHPTSVGLNLIVMVDLPGQKQDADFDQATAILKHISYAKVVSDIADQRLVEESMTAEERENSAARRQVERLSNAAGRIKTLGDYDFDRTVEEDIADDNA